MESTNPEIFTLAGESGSGKTTLARMILGIIEPTSGSIFYEGKDITRIKGRKEDPEDIIVDARIVRCHSALKFAKDSRIRS